MDRYVSNLVVVALAAALLVVGCAHTPEPPVSTQARQAPEARSQRVSLRSVAAAIKTAEMRDVLERQGPVTVFAPTDEAIRKFSAATWQELLTPENRFYLRDVLSYHMVRGTVTAEDVARLGSVRTVNGQKLTLRLEDGRLMVNTARIVRVGMASSNGVVVHAIDRVLLPRM